MQIRHFQTSHAPRLLELLRLNTPEYFSVSEENDFIYYLENEIEQYFVLLVDNEILGCGGFNLSEDKKKAAFLGIFFTQKAKEKHSERL